MWKDIPNWEAYYEINENGEVRNKLTGNYIKGDINNAGYYRVCLYHKSKRQRFFRHRLVAQLFIPNPNNYTEVNHIDGDKSHNFKENLQWCDRVFNEREAHRLNIKEYKPFKVYFQSGEYKEYEFAIDLANELKVTKRTIQNYLQGKSNNYKSRGINEIKYL